MSVLVVAGFHRSGTSMITEMLTRGGLFVGDDLIGARPSNPYGHFEDREIVRLHDELLADVGRTWHVDRPFTPTIHPARWAAMTSIVDRRRAGHRVWGFKDPRVCFFLGAWRYLLPEMRTLVVYRDPRECAWSLSRRHASDLISGSGPAHLHRQFWNKPDHALKMWVSYNRSLVDYVRANREETLVLSHTSITTGLQLVPAVRRVLDIPLDHVDNREVFDPTVTRRRPARQPVADRRVIERVLETWHDLEDLAHRDLARIKEDANVVR